jgi:hypothetical protein
MVEVTANVHAAPPLTLAVASISADEVGTGALAAGSSGAASF